MPRLQVLAGPSPSSLVPITANANKPHKIKSDIFEGQVVVHIKGFTDAEGNVLDSEYFSRPERKGVTWSIQVQGRFLQPVSADDVLFGNTFDRPLKLPWGSSAALRFMHFVDPTLEHDLTSSTRPWALSPLISTMPNFAHTRLASPSAPMPTFPPPPPTCITDDTSRLPFGLSASSSSLHLPGSGSGSRSRSNSGTSTPVLGAPGLSSTPYNPRSANKRRAYFSSAKHRSRVTFTPSDIITTDFCYGFLAFSPSLALNLPGGISFDLLKYWDGQPVRFVCLQRPTGNVNGNGRSNGKGGGKDCTADGRPYWCVAITLVDEDDEEVEDGEECFVDEPEELDTESHVDADTRIPPLTTTMPTPATAPSPAKIPTAPTMKKNPSLRIKMHRRDTIPEGITDEEQLSARILSEAEAERLRLGVEEDSD